MNKLIKICSIIAAVTLLFYGSAAPEPALAQWPPFTFRLTPTHENGRITYRITRLAGEVDWLVSDIQIRIPLPPGLRFVEAVAAPPIQAGFDGREVSFFFLTLEASIKNAYFVVEVIDSTETVFTLQPWLSWQGKFPGNYLTEPITVDVTQPTQFVDWEGPALSPLQLGVSAIMANQAVTYKLYPQKTRRDRLWDLKISLPLPEGTTFLSAAAPPPFETSFDGREVHFFTLELPSQTDLEPLTVNLSTEGVITPVLTTRAWASWKNVARRAVATMGAESQMVTNDIVVQPQAAHYTVIDQAGDVPFGDYDLTSISFQSDETRLQVTFQTAGQLCGSEQPLEFRLFIDADCRADTGEARGELGADYDIRYDSARDRSLVGVWKADIAKWTSVEAGMDHFLGRQIVAVQAPYNALGNNRQFCWAARGRNESQVFVPQLPDDWLPNSNNPRLSQYQPASPAPAALVSLVSQATTEMAMTTPWSACPTVQTASSTTPIAAPGDGNTIPLDIKGRIAVPLYSNLGGYNIHLFSMPEAHEIAQISQARQPNFWADGQRLLFRRPEDNGGIYEYNFVDGTEKLVSERLNHQHPFYDPWGARLVYDNQVLILAVDGIPQPLLLIQCSLFPPHTEVEQRCQDILHFGALLPAGQPGEIQGSHPVWTLTDMIAYTGCSSWAGFSHCGIYTVPSLSTRSFSNGFTPRQLTDHPTDTPSDTKGNFIAFSSQREGNWEAYVVNLTGGGLRNLSTGSMSKDGLPAISPDGYWVAFVSDREGLWAVWATSIDGRQTQKLFDLPAGYQVGMNDQDWLNERLSWGP